MQIILITGGLGSGGAEYAAAHFPDAVVRTDYPEKVREDLCQGLDPMVEADSWLDRLVQETCSAEWEQHGSTDESKQQIVILTREVGDGVVPLDPTERRIREMMGRVNTALASRADQVILMTCGIGVRIK